MSDRPTRDGKPWDGTCPTCGGHVINTLIFTDKPDTMQTTWNCPECGHWWDYLTGRPINVTEGGDA